MDKEKIIEEMVSDMGEWAIENNMCWDSKYAESLARVLIDKGHCKPPVGAVVLTREKLETTDKIPQKIKEFYKWFIEIEREIACKETAKKIFSAIEEYSGKCLEMVDNGVDCELYQTFNYYKFFRWLEKYAKKFGVEV